MKKVQITRLNHYVPIWYQKDFILGPRNTLQYLDRDPPKKELPNGSILIGKELELRSPKQCFREKDLYTTRFGHTLNDEVEKILFGGIDSTGATAVRAFVRNDRKVIHKYFQRFFEYLNAQKQRTPKGLDWIKSKYPNLTQVDLMVEMQHLRHMHGTMWVECVREIVSAEKSDVKFIVTDHPVTVYNSACPPTSSACVYPADPSVGLKGTQTVFALDADHCLILTNLEYAQDPTGVDLLARRQNARHAGQTLGRTDAMIRERMLSPDEVVAINTLLKTRSRQYVAAYKEAWLFPEKTGVIAWEDIGKVLLPPNDRLWGFGGEIYIGYKDGSTRYQDAFGRTDTSHEYLKKQAPPTSPELNDPCPCGSGRRYEKCCKLIAVKDQPPWEIYGIRDRNRIFCNAVIDILGLNKTKTWEDVRRELSRKQVKRVHEVLKMLWPRDTNIADLLPRPDGSVFRAVYMGIIDPRTIELSVISSLAYFDEIVIVNPFPNPWDMDPKYSPTQSPAQHKSQMLKNVGVLLTLQPFIDAGIVHLVPDPMEFNADFRHAIGAMIKKRTANWEPTREDMRRGKYLFRDELERLISRLPKDELRLKLRESRPDIDPELLERTIEYRKKQLVNDPFTLLQPVQSGEDGEGIHVMRGMNLELALFIAHLTGSAIYTDAPSDWRQLHEHTSASTEIGQRSKWAPLAEKLSSLKFPIEVNPLICMEMRETGTLDCIRRVFRCIWNAMLKQGENADVDEIGKQLATSLESASVKADNEWNTCSTTTGPSARFIRRIEMSAPRPGFNMNSVHRMLVTFGRPNCIRSVPIALRLAFDSVQDEVLV